MVPPEFAPLLARLIQYGYPLMLTGMIIEGPIVSIIAGFAAALHYFNIVAVVLLAVCGDLMGDVVYYATGYWGRTKVLEQHGGKIGISQGHLAKMDHLIHTHPWKALLAIKFLPVFATPGLILAGSTRMPAKKFMFISLVVSIPRALVFAGFGFLSGRAFTWLQSYLAWGEYFFLIVIVALAAGYYVLRKLMERVGETLEEEE